MIPTKTPMLDKHLIEEHLVLSNDKPDPLKKIPRHQAASDQFLPEHQNFRSESIGIPMHEFIVGPNPTIKYDGEDPCKK
jgi:hypothetical protein